MLLSPLAFLLLLKQILKEGCLQTNGCDQAEFQDSIFSNGFLHTLPTKEQTATRQQYRSEPIFCTSDTKPHGMLFGKNNSY